MVREREVSDLRATLLRLAQPNVGVQELLKAVKRVHAEAKKKEIIEAAFGAVIAFADSDLDRAVVLQNFAIRGRG